MTERKKIITVLALLILSAVSVVFAIWAAGVIINQTPDSEFEFEVGDAPYVSTMFEITGVNATERLIPSHVPEPGTGEAFFVVVPINIRWQSAQSMDSDDYNFDITGARASFEFSGLFNVRDVNDVVVPASTASLVHVYFVYAENVAAPALNTALNGVIADHSANRTARLGRYTHLSNELTDEFGAVSLDEGFSLDMYFGDEKTVFIVAFIAPTLQGDVQYLSQARINVIVSGFMDPNSANFDVIVAPIISDIVAQLTGNDLAFNFKLERNFTFAQFDIDEVLADTAGLDAWTAALENILNNTDRINAARTIGNDFIVVPYYVDNDDIVTFGALDFGGARSHLTPGFLTNVTDSSNPVVVGATSNSAVQLLADQLFSITWDSIGSLPPAAWNVRVIMVVNGRLLLNHSITGITV